MGRCRQPRKCGAPVDPGSEEAASGAGSWEPQASVSLTHHPSPPSSAVGILRHCNAIALSLHETVAAIASSSYCKSARSLVRPSACGFLHDPRASPDSGFGFFPCPQQSRIADKLRPTADAWHQAPALGKPAGGWASAFGMARQRFQKWPLPFPGLASGQTPVSVISEVAGRTRPHALTLDCSANLLPVPPRRRHAGTINGICIFFIAVHGKEGRIEGRTS